MIFVVFLSSIYDNLSLESILNATFIFAWQLIYATALILLLFYNGVNSLSIYHQPNVLVFLILFHCCIFWVFDKK